MDLTLEIISLNVAFVYEEILNQFIKHDFNNLAFCLVDWSDFGT